eukprot:12472414-Alexandrium_andersonii.AAC.1
MASGAMPRLARRPQPQMTRWSLWTRLGCVTFSNTDQRVLAAPQADWLGIGSLEAFPPQVRSAISRPLLA